MARELGSVGVVLSVLVAGCVAVPPEVTVTETVDGSQGGSAPAPQAPPPGNGGSFPGGPGPTGSGMMGSNPPSGSGGMPGPSDAAVGSTGFEPVTCAV